MLTKYPDIGQRVEILVPLQLSNNARFGTVMSRDGEYIDVRPDGYNHIVELYCCELGLVE